MSNAATSWKAFLAPALLIPSLCIVIPGFAAADDTCLDPLFACETAGNKAIQICSVEEVVGERWSHIQYRFGTLEKPELVYPADSSKGAQSLFFSHVSRKSLYEVSVRFTNGGYTYRVFSIANDKGEGSAGVIVSDAKGKRLSTIHCIERPLLFAPYLQKALACDAANPHGKAACAEHAPRR
ncbi:MAG: hypothetical protein U0Q16_22045 [Bryobacteraceae bacterium]